MNCADDETLNVTGALLVKLFGRTSDEDARFAGCAGQVRDLGVRRALIGRWFFMALGVVSALGTALVFWLGAVLVINGGISRRHDRGAVGLPGQPVRAAVGAVECPGRIRHVAGVLRAGVRGPRSAARHRSSRPQPASMTGARGAVDFDDVVVLLRGTAASDGLESVRRSAGSPSPTGEDGAASGRSPTLGAGGVLVHVSIPGNWWRWSGPSGAGKTTSTYLVPRLYDVTEGAVLIDGNDVRDVTLESLAAGDRGGDPGDLPVPRHHRGQPPVCQAGCHRRTKSAAAAEPPTSTDFVAALPTGYDTVVGERGYRLSGGEKQRWRSPG